MSDSELSKGYEPLDVEQRWYRAWMDAGCFRAEATSTKPAFCIVHAVAAQHHRVLATLATRMDGHHRRHPHPLEEDERLQLPLAGAGTDHAGIFATQMMVEKELKKTEKKSRHDFGRAAFLERVWEWKRKYGQRIGEQHHYLGASLDWSRERFTLDESSSSAVKEVFVRLYEEGLIYRAQKLINWCPSCHTALSDLEVEHEERKGSLWHIHYPVKGDDRVLDGGDDTAGDDARGHRGGDPLGSIRATRASVG